MHKRNILFVSIYLLIFVVYEHADYIFRIAYRYIQRRPQDTKEARVMALLLNLEVLGMYLYYIDISHARAIARASADLLKSSTSMKFPRFQDSLNK